jgi:glycolate oxidase FAD binding subunit
VSTSPTTEAESLRLLRPILGYDGARDPEPEDLVDGMMPSAVVEPATIEEAAGVLAACSSGGLTIVPRGGGTKLDWGSRPGRLDVILSTRRMDAVLEHAAGDLVARVQPGCRLADLQERLASAGQMLALDPPAVDATVGGIVAAGASGPRRLRYGTPRDLVIGITVVLSDGTVARAGGRVVKNVAGYDLGKLFAGSFGTLGLIAELTLRLHPRPESARAVRVEVDDPDAALAAVQLMTSPGLVPSLVELTWPAHDRPGQIEAVYEGVEPGAEAQAHRAMSLLGHPTSPRIGAPALSERGTAPAARTDDGAAPATPSAGIAPSDPAQPAPPLRFQLNHPPAALPAALRACWASADALDGPVAVSGHAASGVTFIETDTAAFGSREADPGGVPTRLTALRAFAADVGGSVLVRSAPPEVKPRLDVWGPAGDAIDLMRRVKERFDPTRTMSPGRFVDGI